MIDEWKILSRKSSTLMKPKGLDQILSSWVGSGHETRKHTDLDHVELFYLIYSLEIVSNCIAHASLSACHSAHKRFPHWYFPFSEQNFKLLLILITQHLKKIILSCMRLQFGWKSMAVMLQIITPPHLLAGEDTHASIHCMHYKANTCNKYVWLTN